MSDFGENVEHEVTGGPSAERASIRKHPLYNVLLVLLAIAALGMAAYLSLTYLGTSPEDVPPPEPTSQPQEPPALSVEDELELQSEVDAIVRSKDYAQCDAVENEMYRKVCVNNIALVLAQETQDVSHCDRVDGSMVPRRYCEEMIV